MSTITATRTKTYDMVYIAVFAVLIAICSWISIPMTVPFTLQTFGVFMAVGVLGGKRGSLAVLIYILLGAIGVPVFSGFTGGIGVILNSTGGYIAGRHDLVELCGYRLTSPGIGREAGCSLNQNRPMYC